MDGIFLQKDKFWAAFVLHNPNVKAKIFKNYQRRNKLEKITNDWRIIVIRFDDYGKFWLYQTESKPMD